MKTCYVLNAKIENQPTHSFMKKHSNTYYSINDCPVNNVTKIISKLFVGLQLYRERKKSFIML